MSNLLIIMTVAYIVAIIMQIGYCIARYEYDNHFDNLTIMLIITSIIFAPIIVLLEIGATLFFRRIN